ncbi:MAG: response regulator transcription factor [Bacteroidia bacterium]|nr:response regulator transcription factor [Bacteroidia bacterium]
MKKLNKILLVEDETDLAESIKAGLEENNYKVFVEIDGLVAKKTALSESFDLIILDVMLPGMSGVDICAQIRKANIKTPILMLTALSSTEDKLIGFNSGADDYLVKPFDFEELKARINSLLNRSQNRVGQGALFKAADLEFNIESKEARRAGEVISLTAKECLLLETFLLNKNKMLSRKELAEKVWDINFDTGTNIVDVYVNFLRKKIDKNHSVKLIHTVKGMGYILKENKK